MFTQSFFARTAGMTLCLSLSLGIASNKPTYAQNDVLAAESALKGAIAQEQGNESSSNAESASSPNPSNEEEVPNGQDGVSPDAENADNSEPRTNETSSVSESGASDVDGQQIGSDNEALYRNLETYLTERNWEAADNETFNLLLALVGSKSQEQGYFSLGEWEAFVADKEKNCPNVQKIDELWKNASNNALGFSAQMAMFRITQPHSDTFYRAIGWISEDMRTTLVEWVLKSQPSPADEAVVYVMNKKPDFQTPEQTRGHLPAMMAWEAPEGQGQRDRRFQLFSACELGVNQ
jgi:hypothetical protein